jgi:hypothetical protein
MSAEDLTTQAGLAVQQDLALVNLIGLTHVERNGHHYVNGFAGQGAGRDRPHVWDRRRRDRPAGGSHRRQRGDRRWRGGDAQCAGWGDGCGQSGAAEGSPRIVPCGPASCGP